MDVDANTAVVYHLLSKWRKEVETQGPQVPFTISMHSAWPIQTSTNCMATGMPVTCADLISRRDISQRHAQGIGVNVPILKLSPTGMHRATSQQATIVAPEECTRPAAF
jgi:hypothetical protein